MTGLAMQVKAMTAAALSRRPRQRRSSGSGQRDWALTIQSHCSGNVFLQSGDGSPPGGITRMAHDPPLLRQARPHRPGALLPASCGRYQPREQQVLVEDTASSGMLEAPR